MEIQRQIRRQPNAREVAFGELKGPREVEIRAAFAAIAPMFWGERLSLDQALCTIRLWIDKWFPLA